MKVVRVILMVVCAALFLLCCGKLYGAYREYDAGTTAYEQLEDRFTAPPQEPEPVQTPQEENPEPETPAETAPITVDFAGLAEENPDIVGWLYCADTVVNYPVMQAENNEKYLRALPDGTWNVAGTLFLDYRNAGDFSDGNSIVYGHNLNNQAMFALLPEYQKQEFYETHPCWYLLTPDADYKIQLIAGFTTPADSEIYTIPQSGEAVADLLQTAREQSDFVSPVTVEEGARLITLSTCSSAYTDARYVLVGVLQELAK